MTFPLQSCESMLLGACTVSHRLKFMWFQVNCMRWASYVVRRSLVSTHWSLFCSPLPSKLSVTFRIWKTIWLINQGRSWLSSHKCASFFLMSHPSWKCNFPKVLFEGIVSALWDPNHSKRPPPHPFFFFIYESQINWHQQLNPNLELKTTYFKWCENRKCIIQFWWDLLPFFLVSHKKLTMINICS